MNKKIYSVEEKIKYYLEQVEYLRALQIVQKRQSDARIQRILNRVETLKGGGSETAPPKGANVNTHSDY